MRIVHSVYCSSPSLDFTVLVDYIMVRLDVDIGGFGIELSSIPI
jgi:hypothetical protein